MPVIKVKFCWLCGNKLWGNHREELPIDYHVRTLHKACAKEIKTSDYDYRKDSNGNYYSTNIEDQDYSGVEDQDY